MEAYPTAAYKVITPENIEDFLLHSPERSR